MKLLIPEGFDLSDLESPDARQVMADYWGERGEVFREHILRTGATLVRDVEANDLAGEYDWQEVFGEGSGGNCDKSRCELCPPDSTVDGTAPNIADVAEAVATINGENDESSWVGIFLLKDGRWLVAEGSCDYTGWDCQAGNSFHIGATLDNVVRYGLSASELARMGGSIPPQWMEL